VTYLVDSHVLLWWLGDPARLSSSHREILANVRNEVVVSSISVAELEIKASLGKLEMPDDLPGAIEAVGLSTAGFEPRHAVALRTLPFHHRDPFDRMLVAQALVDSLIFLTVDDNCKKYDILTR
jgi:PIN domain nuclease of toxin-antitoxin system